MKLSPKGRALVAARVMLIPSIAMVVLIALVADFSLMVITKLHEQQQLHHIQTE